MSDLDNLKRRAGIIAEDEVSNIEFIGNNFINGNQKDTFQAIGGNVSLFAQVAIYLGATGGQESLMNFLNHTARRG